MTPSAAEVLRFRELVAQHLGLVFDDGKLDLLGELLRRRCHARGVAAAAWLDALADGPASELAAIASALTVGETYFFRNHEQFRALAEVVVPAVVRPDRPLRVLSAGCASGEEAYTIAIVARAAGLDPSRVAIRALDINPDAIARARRGRYSAWSLRETPAEVARAWFRHDGRDHVLDDELRASVELEHRNLVADDPALWAPERYDVVFCRNVIMYFAPDTMRRVVTRIARALRPGGYLFLGHAETLRGLSSEFHLCDTHGTFYYRRRAAAEAVEAGAVDVRGAAPPASPAAADPGAWVEAIRRASDRIRALADAPATAPAAGRGWDLDATLGLLRDERFADALASLQQLPTAAAGDPDVLLLRAVLLAHHGELAAAEAVCRRLLEVDELSAGAHYVLALCREDAGERRAARDHDQVAIYLDPTFAMARLHLGMMAKRLGDRDAARRELAQAAELLQREDASRLLLFGGGFQREALITLCRAELAGVEVAS